jgi:PadR family transcriptional regulator AphA
MSLQYGILGLLSYTPLNGYDLGKIFSKSINYAWTASLSQVYRELGVLEKKEYVVSSVQQQDEHPNKKIYDITAEGRKIFMQWLSEPMETFSSPKRDEFSLRLFFISRLGKEPLKNLFKQFIKDRDNFYRKTLGDGIKNNEFVKSAKVLTKTEEQCMGFIAKRVQMTNQLLIQWAQECIMELEEKEL